MTPLPRWVLLAFLLPVASAHPVDHACVRLCRAHNAISELNGVCEDQQKLVLQSVRGRLPIRGLLRLCLTSCHGAPADSPIFDRTETCRLFRVYLIQRKGCPCLNHDRTARLDDPRKAGSEGKEGREDVEEVGRKLESLMGRSGKEQLENIAEEWRTAMGKAEKVMGISGRATELGRGQKETRRVVDELRTSGKIGEEHFVGPADLRGGSLQLEDLPKGIGEDSLVNIVRMDEEGSSGEAENFDSTEEYSIDWDLWCMNQCDNGKGGTACHCDIIP